MPDTLRDLAAIFRGKTEAESVETSRVLTLAEGAVAGGSRNVQVGWTHRKGWSLAAAVEEQDAAGERGQSGLFVEPSRMVGRPAGTLAGRLGGLGLA